MRYPPFIDLEALCTAAAEDEGLRPLLRLCRRARLTQSCKADLAQAQSCLAAISLLPIRYLWKHSSETYTVEGALVFQAVALYARATEANPGRGERGGVNITQQLSPEQLKDHETILAVRNRALAHVYPGEEVAGEELWHNETLFALVTDEGIRPASVSQRVLRHGSNLRRLRRQVPTAERIMLAKFHERLNDLTEFMNHNIAAINWKPVFFDPIERFGDQRVVQQILDAQAEGWGSFIGDYEAR